MSAEYQKPSGSGGLRLHLNENTGGCSPAVVEALRSISCADAAFYHDAGTATAACAQHLGVDANRVILTNGLDEGILCACVAALRGGNQFEALVVVPTFEMYGISATAAGGRVIEIPQPEDFSFPLAAVLAAINDNTRLIFLTTPNNPTGLSTAREEILAIADAAPQALVFVDEAYADFSGRTLIGDAEAERRVNIVVGRTFAKAYGLAALRVGALVGSPLTLDVIRPVVPPYNINVAAALALPAALADTAYHDWYVEQAAQSKAELYAALDRLGVPYWPSDANFVLARFGDRATYVVEELTARRIRVRDHSTEHGCSGCVRITAGVVEHTKQCIAALEEVLCAP